MTRLLSLAALAVAAAGLTLAATETTGSAPPAVAKTARIAPPPATATVCYVTGCYPVDANGNPYQP